MNMETMRTVGKGFKFFVMDKGKEVARAYLYVLNNGLHKEPFGLMEDVFVEKQVRGKGLGTGLVKMVIEEARKQGCYKLIATSRHGRCPVHELYKKLGFKVYGKEFRMDF
ncbi:GNAT family N-acetyltransferase [Candidatus Woesearchaeota archaeon]|nr:GNAT family N-acetyltransferase [Candidatus Woesearchaeota archaeon]